MARIAPLEPEEARIWLEWAGSRLLALKLRSAAPAGYRSFWPDYADDSAAYGYTKETMRAPAVAPDEVPIMDLILGLPSVIDDVRVRRIVHRRCLVTPVSGRYVYSYGKIAEEFHLDPRLAARLFLKGLNEIARKAPVAKIHAIRVFINA